MAQKTEKEQSLNLLLLSIKHNNDYSQLCSVIINCCLVNGSNFNNVFNMKKSKNYNMKKAFEEKHDFDFVINMVLHTVIDGVRSTKLIPVHRFSLFAITVIEARKIAKSINVLPQYICTCVLLTE